MRLGRKREGLETSVLFQVAGELSGKVQRLMYLNKVWKGEERQVQSKKHFTQTTVNRGAVFSRRLVSARWKKLRMGARVRGARSAALETVL